MSWSSSQHYFIALSPANSVHFMYDWFQHVSMKFHTLPNFSHNKLYVSNWIIFPVLPDVNVVHGALHEVIISIMKLLNIIDCLHVVNKRGE